MRYDLTITVAPQGEEWTVTVQGWLLGDTDVNYMRIDEGTHSYLFRSDRCARTSIAPSIPP
jgi:hypothetical protein